MKIALDDNAMEVHVFADKAELVAARPDVYRRIRQIAYMEDDPRMAPLVEGHSVVVIDGDLNIAADEDSASTFHRIYGAIGEEASSTDWVVCTGDVHLERSLALNDRFERVVIFGDLHALGVCNDWGQLFVLGKTTIPGILYFDSDNGGFTQLDLAEPVGLIATQSNAFDVRLRARYFFDPLFSGFDGEPQSPHDERIREAFDGTARVVTLEELAAFFERLDPDVADEVRDGGHYDWIKEVATHYDARQLPSAFDASLASGR
jgi:hypothetical protein